MALYRNSISWTVMFGVMTLMFVKLPPMVANQDSVLNTYSALVEVDALARQQFVSPLAANRLVEGAIRGMMRQLDPYSGYISPEELPGFLRRNRGHYCGVGVEVGVRDGVITVIAPIEGSSAARAGIQSGDHLISVSGRSTDHMTTFEVEELLIGPAGTRVELRLRRAGGAEARQVSLEREEVSLTTVRGVRQAPEGGWDFWLDADAGVGYVRVSNFRENTNVEFDEALSRLGTSRLRSLVIDLRYNPGGFLYQAVAMADRFLSDGLIVSTVSRRGAIDEFRAQPSVMDLRVPLVVLVNGGSASSSEIVAGALQARGRATVVGERSFGKGSVQHLIQLTGHKAAIKLTVAYYRLPDGRIVHRNDPDREAGSEKGWGIMPDVEVVLSRDESQALHESRLSDTDAVGERHEDRQLAAARAVALRLSR